MAKLPNWYSEHPPACTGVDCDRRRSAKKSRNPLRAGPGCSLLLVSALIALVVAVGSIY